MLSSSMMALFAARPRLFVRGVQQEFQFRNGSGDPSQGVQDRRNFRTEDRWCGARFSAGTVGTDIPAVVVDGIVGPMTWQALVNGMLSF
jgi:hypothetical protein